MPLSRSRFLHADLTSGEATFRFYRGDSLRVLETFGDASVDVIVTSPPYNLGIRYRSYDDTMPRKEYLEWTANWVKRAARVLAADREGAGGKGTAGRAVKDSVERHQVSVETSRTVVPHAQARRS